MEAEVLGVVALMKLVDRDESITVAAIERVAGITKEQAEFVFGNWKRGRYPCVSKKGAELVAA